MLCLLRMPAVEAFRFSSASVAMPLGLAYLAGTLEHRGVPFNVLDCVMESPTTKQRYHKGYLVGLPIEKIPERIPQNTSIVGISIIFTHEWPAAVRLIDLIREARPEITIICGGEHITSMPEFSMATSKADFLVLGEGEEILIDLLNSIESGKPVNNIDGIVYREEGKIISNKRRARRTDLDDIPKPAWHRFDVEAYSKNKFVGGMDVPDITVPMLATRGCPYQCTFCSSPNMWTTRWIARSPKLVVDEMEYYIKKFGARNFPFQDLTAIIKKDWIIEICKEILDRGLNITWQLPTGTRSEAIDLEVAKLLKKSGQISMTYAPESGSDRTRQYIKKKVRSDRLVESLKACAEADLNVAANVIIGFPHETDEYVAENLPFARRLKKAGCEDLVAHYYMALPGTEIFNSLYDAGNLKVNGAYFRHILASVSLWPGLLFNDGRISKLKLLVWKLRISLVFYAASGPRKGQGGLFSTFSKMISGLTTREHSSRLQTAIRHLIASGFHTIKVQFTNGWLPRCEEARFFENWPAIFDDIRRQLLTSNVVEQAQTDTTEIHKISVVPKLRQDHESTRILNNPNV